MSREEIGFSDMGKYEFGGLQIDGKLENGYLLYIPYGIHKDIFDAIEQGVIEMGQRNDDIRDSISKTSESDTIPYPVRDAIIHIFNRAIERNMKHIEVLETILPISDEI